MENELIWLRTSLFAEKCQWGNILRDGIKVFIEDISNKQLIKDLLVEFNYLSGENIRFAVLVKTQRAELTALKIDTFFKQYFESANFSNKEVVLPVMGVFLPFPPNTTQYGLYNIEEENDKLLRGLSFITSLCLIEAFQNSIVDEELLIAFAFYLHVAVLDQLEIHFENKLNYLSIYKFEDYQLKKDALDKGYLTEKYLENKQPLIEIRESLKNYNTIEFRENLPWLLKWLNSYKLIFAEQPPRELLIFDSIRNCINKQLGLNDNMKLLLYYFICNVYMGN